MSFSKNQKTKNRRVASAAVLLVGVMLGAAYAAVPLYDLFCRVTGFGGTPQVAAKSPDRAYDRRLTVRFDAGLHRDMAWEFTAPQQVSLPIGEQALVFYTARNPTDEAIVGTATYNVSPPQAGYYFAKIDCFCFTEQTLQPGEETHMPVSFFIDPEILTDPDMAGVGAITLSYTFFKSKVSPKGG